MAEASLPIWLTADFLKSCLDSNDQFKDVTIVDFSAEPAVAPGNNYGSLLLRAKVQFKLQEERDLQNISLIIKYPVVELLEQLGKAGEGLYVKEPKFYYNFIHESNQPQIHDIFAKHYLSPKPLCVVLEDLKASGYKMVDRHELLDLDHCRLYIEAATRLQALSVATHKKNPDLIEFLGNEREDEAHQKLFLGMVLSGFFCMCEFLQDKPEYQEHLSLIKEMTKGNNLITLYEEMKKSKCNFKTLNQDDPWCTNMMFKYNASGEPVGIKLLDFQGLNFSTPVRGFLAFLWLAVSSKVRETKLDHLCLLYCDSLNKNLENLGCPEKLSLEDLKKEIILWSSLTLSYVCVFLPLCLADEVVDMSDFFRGEIPSEVGIKKRPVYKLYQGENFNRNFPNILDQVAKLGAFDYLRERIKQLS